MLSVQYPEIPGDCGNPKGLWVYRSGRSRGEPDFCTNAVQRSDDTTDRSASTRSIDPRRPRGVREESDDKASHDVAKFHGGPGGFRLFCCCFLTGEQNPDFYTNAVQRLDTTDRFSLTRSIYPRSALGWDAEIVGQLRKHGEVFNFHGAVLSAVLGVLPWLATET